jgi:hypothetical protein
MVKVVAFQFRAQGLKLYGHGYEDIGPIRATITEAMQDADRYSGTTRITQRLLDEPPDGFTYVWHVVKRI